MKSRGTVGLVTLIWLFAVPLSEASPGSGISPASALSNRGKPAARLLRSQKYESVNRILKQAKSSAPRLQDAKKSLPVPGSDAQYHFDVWTTDNGLPQNSVASILQNRDGFLWFTTNDGLVRYDGVGFTVFNAGNRKDLKTSRFSQIFEDAQGGLWTITEDHMLIGYREGHFKTYTTEDGLPHNHVVDMLGDAEGNLLAETLNGVAIYKDRKFTVEGLPDKRAHLGFGVPDQPEVVWHFDSPWLYRVENGRRTREIALNGLVLSDIKSLYEDRNGELWVGITNGIVLRFKDGKRTDYAKKNGLPGNRVNIIRGDREGNIWFGLEEAGLFRFRDGRFTNYTTSDGLAGNNILFIYEDREGILWIGTTAGLSRLRDNIITAYSTENGLSANNIYPIYQDREGAIWIGSWKGLTRYKDGRFTPCGEQYGVAGALVTALLSDRQDNLWIGSLGGGAIRYKDGKMIRYQAKDGLPSNVVRAILQDRQGAIWFGTSDGVARLKDGTFSAYTIEDGLPGNSVSVLFEDRQGNLWIGTQRGLCRYREGQFHTYPQEESIANHLVRSVYEDGEGVIWIGTYDSGLTRLKDGKFTNYTMKEGLFNNGVFQILEDARENFWISCNLGIYRVSKRELTEYAEGRVKAITSIPYGKRDGMLNSECNGGAQPAGIKNLDGKLWFPTQGGVAVVDPEAVPVSAQPPTLMIEEFLLNNEPTEFREAVEILPGIENFEIHYTGLSFIMSERLRFKYKLEGLNADWVDAGTRRVAYYSHIPPGDYIFRVIAANRDGVWNMQGASVQIRIIPPFWRTWWFYALAVTSGAGIVVLGFKFRIRQLEKAKRAQEAFSQQLISSQESERQRIAAELHDSLGQHLLIIKNSALLGINALEKEDRGKEQLDDISATASQAIDEVREISYNLRPYQLDNLGLTKAIEFIVAKVAASSEIRFSANVQPIDGLFSPAAEINIYRIVQESLNNIVKHSGASQARIHIERNASHVALTIQDNGRGFNTEKANGHESGGGFGLKGIAERARMLGAKYVVQSAAGQGTTLTLNVETRNGRREK
jgi:signal transduction histidine kinase/ligand-binding sensor domain-containing protein